MESHPVPKNVLTVEFKLFGSLTARQFLKIVAACLTGLLVFALPFIPKIISVPIAAGIILLGVMSAIMPGFAAKFGGLWKAIFVSSRYVWRKSDNTPEVLNKEAEAKKKAKPQKKMQSAAPDLTDISIDKLLEARASSANDDVFGDTTSAAADADEEAPGYFNRVYEQEFGKQSLQQSLQKRQQAPVTSPVVETKGLAQPAGVESVPIGPGAQATINPVNNSAPRSQVVIPPDQAAADNNQFASASDQQQLLNQYSQQIQALQQQLQAADQQQKQELIAQINDIYAQMKQIVSGNQAARPMATAAVNTRLLFGVVVDKKDTPIDGAKVILKTAEGEEVSSGQSGADGRFSIEIDPSLTGAHVVHVEHPNYSFYEFKVDIGQDKLPGYKFRAK